MNTKKIRSFRKVLRRFERELETQNTGCGCCGVTVSQCHALMALEEKEGINLYELAEKLGLDNSTTSRIVDGLVKIGLMERSIPPEDRRSVLLSLTSQGREVCQSIHRNNDEYFMQVFNKMNRDDVDIFVKSLDVIASNMEEINRRIKSESNSCND